MFINTLSQPTKKLLELLKPFNLPKDSYLAGGTAIALQIGHRMSNDLDFFTSTKFSEIMWESKLTHELGLETNQRDWQTIAGNIKGVKFSLFYYPDKLISEPVKYDSVSIASLPDLCGIKLNTIISRGAKRDLIDVYFLARKFTLKQMFDFYQEKYGNFSDREIMIKKALVYFEDANEEEDPKMLVKDKWEDIKTELREMVKSLDNGSE